MHILSNKRNLFNYGSGGLNKKLFISKSSQMVYSQNIQKKPPKYKKQKKIDEHTNIFFKFAINVFPRK